MPDHRKKLIEVALPLTAINDASAYDKMPGIGPHPKGIHQWWARLPLPTARAILFASVVNDPEANPDKWPTEESQNAERERLFNILRRLMGKKLHEAPEVYAEARAEMLRHSAGTLPTVFDPFAGGGSIPLEANRLGFDSHGGDLNPVAVLLNKCNLELAPRWCGQAPVNPENRGRIGGTENWRGTHGLAADVRYYGQLISQRVHAKIGHLYPKVRLPKEHGSGDAHVIAWIWARTVASPHPTALQKHVPLISTYWLSNKKGKVAWLRAVVNKRLGVYEFEVHTEPPKDRAEVSKGTKLGRGAKFRCLITDEPIDEAHIKTEARAGRLGSCLLAVVADGPRGRIYLNADSEQEARARAAVPSDFPTEQLAYDSRYLTPPGYGMTSIDKLFTPRQLTAMVTLSNEVKAVNADVLADASAAGIIDQTAAVVYARTVTTFLALALDRCADFNNALCRWKASGEQLMQLFGRQAIPMVWDFAESNILGTRGVCWDTAVGICSDAVETLLVADERIGQARQIDAAAGANGIGKLLVSTDPPYYDNVPYADISDFFYVWLRRTVGNLYPDLFSTLLVPKVAELTASPQRFDGDKEKAKVHFETGFNKTFSALRERMDPEFPLTVYYAFKQDDEEASVENENSETGVDLTTGWETLLEALVSSGFQITATWPVRASQAWRMRAMGSNALASYIVLACRPRAINAPQTASTQFRQELKHSLPSALRHLREGNIAPVDFAQASIGPGMAVYSRYSKIIESDSSAMTVRTALGVINRVLDEILAEQEGEFDAETRWAIAWFEQFGMQEGSFGIAETLSKAKNTAVNGLVEAGLVKARAGKVRLLNRTELKDEWEHAKDMRPTVWEATQHLIHTLDQRGESAAAAMSNRLSGMAETARDLAYRLYSICERNKWPDEALAYNGLVIAWPELTKLALAERSRPAQPTQRGMF